MVGERERDDAETDLGKKEGRKKQRTEGRMDSEVAMKEGR